MNAKVEGRILFIFDNNFESNERIKNLLIKINIMTSKNNENEFFPHQTS